MEQKNILQVCEKLDNTQKKKLHFKIYQRFLIFGSDDSDLKVYTSSKNKVHK